MRSVGRKGWKAWLGKERMEGINFLSLYVLPEAGLTRGYLHFLGVILHGISEGRLKVKQTFHHAAVTRCEHSIGLDVRPGIVYGTLALS